MTLLQPSTTKRKARLFHHNSCKCCLTHHLLLQCRTKGSQGFTLIELLVVVIIVGLLAAIALPNYLGQIGKSREAEAKSSLGTIARAQEAYHFEKQVFASDFDVLTLQGSFSSRYYSFLAPEAVAGDDFKTAVKHRAEAIDEENDRVRNYAVGTYFSIGNYDNFLCQGSAVGEAVNVPDNTSGTCTNNGERIQ